MALYNGERTMDGIRVLVEGEPLDPRFDLKEIAINGFEWSYEGDEPAQLALALLAHHLGDDAKALSLHDHFMRRIVSNFDNYWEMTSDDIDTALGNIASDAA